MRAHLSFTLPRAYQNILINTEDKTKSQGVQGSPATQGKAHIKWWWVKKKKEDELRR